MSEPAPTPPLPERALAAVLDLLIPPSADGRLPGAGELGLARHVEELTRANPALRPLLLQGLDALEARAASRGSRYAELPHADRRAALDELTQSLPGFAPTLCFLVYTGYYRDPGVVAALGLEDRPPFPKGHQLAEGDFTLLEAVRRRGRLYREC